MITQSSASSEKPRSSFRSLFPSLSDYRELPRSWRSDLLAGLTVGIVALPLALGFGISSGAGAEAGLITAIIAGIIAAVFGGSHVQVSGPTGAMVVVLAPIVAQHGVGAVALVSLMAGIMVVAMGVLRLGRAVSVIPWPVIEGFTLGIAATIFLQQVPSVTSGDDGQELSTNVVVAAWQSITSLDPGYLLWALVAVAIVAVCMVVSPRIHHALPGSLIGIILVTVLALLLPTPLQPIGEIPNSLPAPTLPMIDFDLVGELLLPAFTVALLAAIESLLSARVASSMADVGGYEPDRELVGQGLASVGAGFFGGMPATGAIARTAVNVRSGARTRFASIVHALVLLVIISAVSGPVSMIPLAALAGVLMVTAVRMVNTDAMMSILRSTRSDALAFVITAFITVAFDLIVAVVIGVVIASIVVLRSISRRSDVTREPLPGVPVEGDERIALLRLDGPLFFAAADRMLDSVVGIDEVSVVILRMSQLELVDATGAHSLTEIVQGLERRGITVLIKGVKPAHRDLFRSVGVLRSLRHHKHLFDDLPHAIEHARDHIRRERAGQQ
ncbi:SulP family inorganic anion transporter [Brevibacterium daeguense]|uniref:SulP family inorganic anion transporter n=1 Tax=Brevibacterium daeguense TaxID=909936 RepID=A0ABP8EKK4_9MICO